LPATADVSHRQAFPVEIQPQLVVDATINTRDNPRFLNGKENISSSVFQNKHTSVIASAVMDIFVSGTLFSQSTYLNPRLQQPSNALTSTPKRKASTRHVIKIAHPGGTIKSLWDSCVNLRNINISKEETMNRAEINHIKRVTAIAVANARPEVSALKIRITLGVAAVLSTAAGLGIIIKSVGL
jgi:hypothetical protein